MVKTIPTAAGKGKVRGHRGGAQKAGVKCVVHPGATLAGNNASAQLSAGRVDFIPAPDPDDGGLVPIGTR